MRTSTKALLGGLGLVAWGGGWMVFGSMTTGTYILNTITVCLGCYVCIMAGKLRAYDD